MEELKKEVNKIFELGDNLARLMGYESLEDYERSEYVKQQSNRKSEQVVERE